MSWKVSEEKVSGRSNWVQFYRENEGSQDLKIVTHLLLSGPFGRAVAAGWWLGRGRLQRDEEYLRGRKCGARGHPRGRGSAEEGQDFTKDILGCGDLNRFVS